MKHPNFQVREFFYFVIHWFVCSCVCFFLGTKGCNFFKNNLSVMIMILASEIRSQIEEIAKRAGYLWRYL